jgi:hypothetical protein
LSRIIYLFHFPYKGLRFSQHLSVLEFYVFGLLDIRTAYLKGLCGLQKESDTTETNTRVRKHQKARNRKGRRIGALACAPRGAIASLSEPANG